MFLIRQDTCVVSFHVGSGVADAEAFPTAVASASSVFDIGLHLGFDFNILDIGGGFPGHAGAPISFEKVWYEVQLVFVVIVQCICVNSL